ncbi:NAD(P)-dependent alcohol dehydrogenase [Rhodococcus sp. NPDC127528]|uniref:NAD(P)-dependent alcohol dehydrogenase n=1 Tax=unclassified Rhodococcus (in: high G+C Gram-positive bacteria) TaxID=192944 RepID=UPI00363784ED
MRVTAALSHGPTTPFTLETVDLDDLRPDEILVRIVAAGPCHTDLVTQATTPAEAGPSILGHEGAGVVTEVGAAVRGVTPGDHVVLTYRHCAECEHCLSGHPAYCELSLRLNNSGRRADGSATVHRNENPVRAAFFGQSSFAQYAIATADNVVVVDKEVDLSVAAPLGCGFQTGAGAVLNVLRPGPGARLVVFGAGSVGLAALLAARAAGVSTLVVVDPVADRRALAETFGATAVDPDEHVVDRVVAATRGGATHALDTTGSPTVLRQALTALRARGELVAVGLGRPELTLDVQDLMRSGKSLRGCIEGDSVAAQFIPELLEMHAARRFPIEQLVTTYPFEDINRAVADQVAGKVVKPVLVW